MSVKSAIAMLDTYIISALEFRNTDIRNTYSHTNTNNYAVFTFLIHIFSHKKCLMC